MSQDGGSLATQLEAMSERYAEADKRANEFADDAAALLVQLQAVQESQRLSLGELKMQVGRGARGVADRVRSLKTSRRPSAAAPPAVEGAMPPAFDAALTEQPPLS